MYRLPACALGSDFVTMTRLLTEEGEEEDEEDEEEEETGLALVTPLHPDEMTAADSAIAKIHRPIGLRLAQAAPAHCCTVRATGLAQWS